MTKKVSGRFSGTDGFGKHNTKPKRATEEQITGIRNHIESFPPFKSQYMYAQQTSNRKHHAAELNLKTMYKAYVIFCKNKHCLPVTETKYKRVFNQEYKFTGHNKIKRMAPESTCHNKMKCKGRSKIPEEQHALVRKHLESFPILEPHFTQPLSTRKYFNADLNFKRMYEAYVMYCKSKKSQPLTKVVFERVFHKRYKFAFHRPKRDQCPCCSVYLDDIRRGFSEESSKEQYQMHKKRLEIAKEQKRRDCNKATWSKSVHTCTFFFQPALYTPCSQESHTWYMRKLYCHNLSIYGAKDKKATCFLWSETDGKHGSNEISTCLNLYVSRLDPLVQHVILYSDFITGQNRNQIIAKCLLYSVITIQNIQVIDYKVFESGHTYKECCKLNSAIEFAKSTTEIVVPCQWESVIFMAQRINPYSVVMLEHKDFQNFKGMKYETTDENASESKAEWGNMKWMRFKKETPDICYYKYDLEETDFQTLKMVGKKAKKQPQQLYPTKLPISIAKKNDLLSMCKHGVIPTEFYDYYNSLPASTSVLERLPEPDRRELDVDTDIEEEELEVDTDITEESDMNTEIDENELSKDEKREKKSDVDTEIEEEYSDLVTSIKEEESGLDNDFEDEELDINTYIEEGESELGTNTDVKESVQDTGINEKTSDMDTEIKKEELDKDTYIREKESNMETDIREEQSELDTDITEKESDRDTDGATSGFLGNLALSLTSQFKF